MSNTPNTEDWQWLEELLSALQVSDDLVNMFRAAIQSRIHQLTEAAEWLLSSDTGTSSKTLCAHMLGIDATDYKWPPSDADDRGRCVRLLQRVPEWIPRLDEMTEYSGWSEQVPLIKAALHPQDTTRGQDSLITKDREG